MLLGTAMRSHSLIVFRTTETEKTAARNESSVAQFRKSYGNTNDRKNRRDEVESDVSELEETGARGDTRTPVGDSAEAQQSGLI